ncbi:FAD-dependent oxidoreductase [Streptomyces sp. NPDC018693]|uniref:FAD-dependent oxidoreductase n=1 Tax=unclassified Streptomyces TaxID=2593676 RepID=UPI0037AF990D
MQDGDVVVIGGGYAGVRLARRLDGTARVTLEDRKEVFFSLSYGMNGAVVHSGRRAGRRRDELGAEIRPARPDARVTLAHSGPELLHATGRNRAGRKARAWLEAHGVEVRLDSFMSPGKGFGTYRDERGDVLAADLILLGHGHHRQHALAAARRTR